MSRIEEMIAVGAAVPQTMRHLLALDRMRAWIAPNVVLIPRGASRTLAPGDRFRLESIGAFRFEYVVEAITDREVVLSFDGPWAGTERWSFVADGSETIVRRCYEVNDDTVLGWTAWMTIGRAAVLAHYKFELSRFRDAVQRDPGPMAEIERGRAPQLDFPVDEG